MKKKIVIIVSVLVMFGAILVAKGIPMLKEANAKLNAMANADIDMTQVEDGIYMGSSDGGLVKAEVRVEVKNHRIVQIELLKHENLKGKPAEAILDVMMEQNTDDVDAVSGATASSKTIRNAVNIALQKGLFLPEEVK